jgi:hypothetical protein
MKAELLLDRRVPVTATAFVEMVLWRVPRPVEGCSHSFKYRLAYVVDGVCVLRYDNEAGKGDHRHNGSVESSFDFSNVDNLLAAFLGDVRRWDDENGRA